MIHTRNPHWHAANESGGECMEHECRQAVERWHEGYRQALFDSAKELSDHGHLLAAQRLIDAANLLDPHYRASGGI